ncbi:hypothetical protein JCM1841_004612 [Sporobolomyces salmonicolor]
MAGESRTELVAWISDLLQLNTKVEQCGTGAVYCQIFDSIYHDVPMGKVKMQAKQEYEYLANFRILQNAFKAHGVDKPIPVDRLVRCKMQDNLEFLQWLKRYWDMHYQGGEYDAVGRRKGQGGLEGARAPSVAGNRSTSSASSAAAARRPVGARPAAGGVARTAPSARASGVDPAQLEALTSQMNDMKLSVEGLEKERDFYFNKLREIEIIIGARLESNDETISDLEKDTLLSMQQILYSTEEGFEVPDDAAQDLVDEEETF